MPSRTAVASLVVLLSVLYATAALGGRAPDEFEAATGHLGAPSAKLHARSARAMLASSTTALTHASSSAAAGAALLPAAGAGGSSAAGDSLRQLQQLQQQKPQAKEGLSAGGVAAAWARKHHHRRSHHGVGQHGQQQEQPQSVWRHYRKRGAGGAAAGATARGGSGLAATDAGGGGGGGDDRQGRSLHAAVVAGGSATLSMEGQDGTSGRKSVRWRNGYMAKFRQTIYCQDAFPVELPGSSVVRAAGGFALYVHTEGDRPSAAIKSSPQGWRPQELKQLLWAMEAPLPQPTARLVHTRSSGPTDAVVSATNGSKVFVDVGAGFGWFTLNLAAHGYRVAAFEGVRRSGQMLRNTLCLNRDAALMDNVALFAFGLSQAKDKCFAACPDDDVSSVRPLCGPADEAAALGALPPGNWSLRGGLALERLDDVLPQGPVRAMRIDAGGYEPLVLLGAKGMFKRSRVWYLLTQLDPAALAFAAWSRQQAGLDTVEVDGSGDAAAAAAVGGGGGAKKDSARATGATGAAAAAGAAAGGAGKAGKGGARSGGAAGAAGTGATVGGRGAGLAVGTKRARNRNSTAAAAAGSGRGLLVEGKGRAGGPAQGVVGPGGAAALLSPRGMVDLLRAWGYRISTRGFQGPWLDEQGVDALVAAAEAQLAPAGPLGPAAAAPAGGRQQGAGAGASRVPLFCAHESLFRSS